MPGNLAHGTAFADKAVLHLGLTVGTPSASFVNGAGIGVRPQQIETRAERLVIFKFERIVVRFAPSCTCVDLGELRKIIICRGAGIDTIVCLVGIEVGNQMVPAISNV
jgi:hypothetical protein